MTERYDIAAFRTRPDGLGGHARTGVSSLSGNEILREVLSGVGSAGAYSAPGTR